MSGVSVVIDGGFPRRPGHKFARYVGKLTNSERATCVQGSGIKHARLVGSAACFAALAGRALIKRMGSGETGIICTGGPWALAACSTFIDRATEAGPMFANPLLFPATLVSATATANASLLNTHAFAYVVGHDRLAFFEALHQASNSVHFGFAAQVLVLAISSGDSYVESARERTVCVRPSLDVSIAFGITAENSQASLRLLRVHIDSDVPGNGECYEAEWHGDTLACQIDTPLEGGEAYGASGAVFCLAAAKHHAATATDPTAPFSVVVRTGGRSATAIFQSTGNPEWGAWDEN
jgi:hypothetical protein